MVIVYYLVSKHGWLQNCQIWVPAKLMKTDEKHGAGIGGIGRIGHAFNATCTKNDRYFGKKENIRTKSEPTRTTILAKQPPTQLSIYPKFVWKSWRKKTLQWIRVTLQQNAPTIAAIPASWIGSPFSNVRISNGIFPILASLSGPCGKAWPLHGIKLGARGANW